MEPVRGNLAFDRNAFDVLNLLRRGIGDGLSADRKIAVHEAQAVEPRFLKRSVAAQVADEIQG